MRYEIRPPRDPGCDALRTGKAAHTPTKSVFFPPSMKLFGQSIEANVHARMSRDPNSPN